MGALIPNPQDLEVVDALNTRFSGSPLARLRAHIQANNDDFFAPGRRLRRITWRLRAFPVSGGNRPKGRWLTFLETILPANIHDQILSELRDAVGQPGAINNNCAGVRFWATYEPNLAQPYDLVVARGTPDGSGLFWKMITLKCRTEIPINEPGNPGDPNPDPGEHGPPHPTLAGKTGSRKGKAKKSKAKKAVKRATKKKKR
jgi:hypothetical protein